MVAFENAKYTVRGTSKFKKEIRLAKKRGLDIKELYPIVKLLANGETLPEKYEEHALEGKWKGHRECHVRPDWLLIYQIKEDMLVLELTRTGTHADLFGK